ncbi:MAG: DUF1684 domain-containing protein [Candidatus Bathyarchaeia archaeon]
MNPEAYCQSCGEKQQFKGLYCWNCGALVEAEPASEPEREMTDTEIEALLRMRREKDIFFKYHPYSPIPRELRSKFTGLNYFPVDPSYRFLCRINRYCTQTSAIMMTSTGEEKGYLRVGYFRFMTGGKVQSLQAYSSESEGSREGEKETLFIPFRDETSGKESYGAGRYLEAELKDDGLFILDFNRAYNPYCAYSVNYSCPIPPKGNWLEVEVKAGEKIFKE